MTLSPISATVNHQCAYLIHIQATILTCATRARLQWSVLHITKVGGMLESSSGEEDPFPLTLCNTPDCPMRLLECLPPMQLVQIQATHIRLPRWGEGLGYGCVLLPMILPSLSTLSPHDPSFLPRKREWQEGIPSNSSPFDPGAYSLVSIDMYSIYLPTENYISGTQWSEQ